MSMFARSRGEKMGKLGCINNGTCPEKASTHALGLDPTGLAGLSQLILRPYISVLRVEL